MNIYCYVFFLFILQFELLEEMGKAKSKYVLLVFIICTRYRYICLVVFLIMLLYAM